MPSFRVLIAAAGLGLAIFLAVVLTPALPGSGAVQAQEDHEEPGAQATQVTPAAATLTVSNVRWTSADLTISGHTGAWYIKANKGPDSNCKWAGQTTYTYSARNLTDDTEYTYTAYSDNACTTANKLDDVTFTTLEKKLVLSDWGPFEKLGQNTATLDVQGFSRNLAHLKGDDSGAPHSTCTKWTDVDEAGAGVIALTGLEPGTEYTYRGYEDSACATEVASITFTTLPAALTASRLGLTTASLTLTGHLGRAFYYQANTGPHTACTLKGAEVTDYSSIALSGLTKDTKYTYTAYTDSACSSANKLDDVTFTTLSVAPTLTVSYVSPTTAMLTMSEGWTGVWQLSADAFESGHCHYGGVYEDGNIMYLTGLTPGATYIFKAYAFIPGFVNFCTAEIGAEVTFTTPAQLTECDGLSVAAAVTRNESTEAWSRYVEVTNNTDQVIHDVRALTYYAIGQIATSLADPLYDRQHNARTMPALQPGATGQVGYTAQSHFDPALAEVNGVVQRVNPATSAVLCETAIEPSWWRDEPDRIVKKGPANPEYWVSTQLDNPAPGAGENATFTVTAYATTRDQLLQACVNLHFDGLEPVDADRDGNHDVVIYDGPNGKYKEDGTLNQDSQGNDLGFRRAGRLDYDSDGYDEDVASYRHRPQCSDADGKFQGGLFRIGNTERRTGSSVKWPTATGAYAWPLTYTVKVPVTATGSGSGCLTATVRALPPEVTDALDTAYEKAQNNTAKACLGPPPSGDPELPVLFQEGRADLLTLRPCTDTNFPCSPDSSNPANPADPLVRYVVSGVEAAGVAAANAGSPYRAFRSEDVVVHVPDMTGVRRANRVDATGTQVIVWYSGNARADDPDDSNDFGINPGVSNWYRYAGRDFRPHVWSICDRYAYPQADTDPICKASAADTTPGNIRGLNYRSWSFVALNLEKLDGQPSRSSSSSSTSAQGIIFEFDELGTHVADIIMRGTQNSGQPNESKAPTVGRHTFHVGPAADLRVYAGGDSASVASGKRTFTILAESEPTPEINAYITVGSGLHTHTEQINLHTLIPAVTVTGGGAAIPAANVSQVGASAGSYDTATGVWTLPDGFQGQATLTLVADASAVSSVTAAITNSAEVCENAAGVHQDVDNPGASNAKTSAGKEACEWYLDADGNREQHSNADKATGYHWGAYQRCIKTDASAVGLDPDNATTYIKGKTACTTNAATNTWHTTEVYDWRPHNNEVTFTPSAYGFGLSAGPGDRASIDLSWSRQTDADSYAIYSVSAANLSSPPNLGALLSVNQLDVVSGDVTRYSHDGLSIGETRYYLVRARKDGRPYAMSGVACATARTPVHTYTEYVRPLGPEVVTATARGQGVIELSWSGPETLYDAAVAYYEVEYSTDGVNWHTLVPETTATDYVHRGLTPGTTWHYRVYAHNAQGHSLRSVSARATTDAGSLATLSLSTTTPEAGAPVRATLAFSDGTAPDAASTTWQWQRSTSGASGWADIAGATGDAYTPGPADEGAWLRAVATYPDPTYPAGRLTAYSLGKFVYARPVGVTAEAAWPQGVRLTWSGPGTLYEAEVDYYEIEASVDGVHWATLVPETTATEYVHKWPATGSIWHYRVYAHNAAGRSLHSAPVQGIAGGLKAEADGLTRIYLSWAAPAEFNGAPAQYYEIEHSADGVAWQQLAPNVPAAEYVDASLDPGMTRHYRVYAHNAAGRSVASAPVSATTIAEIGGASDLSATVNADGSVTLAWTPGANANVHAFAGQRVTEDGIDNGSYSFYGYADELAGQAVPAADLISGGWTFFVLAGYRTRDGGETWTGERPIPSVAVEVREPGPTALTAAADGPANIVLDWAPPPGTFYELPAESYEIEYSTDGSAWQQLATNVLAASYTDAGLKAGETRHYRVYAHNARGRSLASEPVSATTIQLAAAADVSAVLNEDGTVTVTWTPGANANLHFVVGLRKNAAGAYDYDNVVYVPASSPDSHTLDLTGQGLAPGTYAFTVQVGYESRDGTRTMSPDPAEPFAEVVLK